MAIVITKQPVNVACAIGDTVSFTVEATGVASYQWQYSSSGGQTWGNPDWDGAATATLTVKATATRKTFLLRCRLTGGDGEIVYTDIVQMVDPKPIPAFTYDGDYETKSDADYWYILLKSSGTLTLSRKKTVDAILIGGGGAGQNGTASSRRGGGSGYNQQPEGVELAAKTEYVVVIGDGAARGSNQTGEATTAFGYTANGGHSGQNGGAGTAQGGANYSDSSDGAGGDGFLLFDTELLGWVCGAGGGGSATADLVVNPPGGKGGGGNGGYLAFGGSDGEANTGGGGGAGGYNSGQELSGSGGAGGNGLVVIRGTQKDGIPVVFDGTELDAIVFDGVEVESLIVDGVTVY